MATLAELLTPRTATDLKTKLLALLQAKGYPTTDWVSGSIDRTLLEIFAESQADQSALVQTIAEGGFVELATGDWLSLLTSQLYQTTRYPASFTEGTVKLTNGTGSPIVFTAGQLRVKFPTGNVYSNVIGDTAPASSFVNTTFRSEGPNDSAAGKNYTDGNNTLTSFLVGLPGLTPSNPAADYSTVTLVGNGTGTVAPTNIAGTPTPSSVVVRIDSSGDVGVATFSYQLDGGSYVSGGIIAATFDITARGVRLNFANGAGTPNSYLRDDTYSFVTPSSWITLQGTDEELDPALVARSIGRWPTLSLAPTETAYSTWARTASSSVIDVRAAASTTIPGGVNIILVGQAGAVPPAVVTTVQTYINQRAELTDRPLVQSAVPVAVVVAGAVTVKLANLAQAQSEAQTNVSTSIRAAGIGGTYYLAQYTEDLMRATGVTNVTGLTINGVAADLVFTTLQVGSFTQVLSTTLSWITV